jgi:hypothetical protein
MAIDNKTKRRAAAGVRAPVPDGTLSADDRAAIAGIYPVERDDPSLPPNLEDVSAELFGCTAIEDVLEAIAAELFVDTGSEVTMLGEATGTIAWHFASAAPDRNVKGSFEEYTNPDLHESQNERAEKATARLHLPYDDTNGVENPSRNDTVTVRGLVWDVASVGAKQGGCRIIELVRITRLHEHPTPVYRERL